MYIQDEVITDKETLEEVLSDFLGSGYFTEEMDSISQPIVKSFSSQDLVNTDTQITAMNTALVEKLMEHFQSFEVENYQLFGISNGENVKLSWIED